MLCYFYDKDPNDIGQPLWAPKNIPKKMIKREFFL